MVRTILVDESEDRQYYARAYETKEKARAALKRLAKKHGWQPYQIVDDSVGDIFLVDEQAGGLWVGFSTADRETICGSIDTMLEDDFIGNDDPRFYLTYGVPSGKRIAYTPSIQGSGQQACPHPLYKEWLTIHGYLDLRETEKIFLDIRVLIDQLEDGTSPNQRRDLCNECRQHLNTLKNRFEEDVD